VSWQRRPWSAGDAKTGAKPELRTQATYELSLRPDTSALGRGEEEGKAVFGGLPVMHAIGDYQL